MPNINDLLKKTPRTALRCTVPAEVLAVSNGDGAKSLKVHLQARSKLAINHWYWGAMYHDFSGMTHRGKIAIDREHDQEIGWAGKFSVTDFGLEIDGIVLKRPDNPQHGANDTAFALENGIPQEASIDFFDPDMKIEYLDSPNAIANVNGMQVQGPAIIFREWKLRAVAICKEGYDAATRTETALAANGDLDLSACLLSAGEPGAAAAGAPAASAVSAPAIDPAVPPPPAGESGAGAAGAPAASAVSAPAVDPAVLQVEIQRLTGEVTTLNGQVTALTVERTDLAARLHALAGGAPAVPRSATPPAVAGKPATAYAWALAQFGALLAKS